MFGRRRFQLRTQETADRIEAAPSAFSVSLIDDTHPAGALRGEPAPLGSRYLFFPTVAKRAG